MKRALIFDSGVGGLSVLDALGSAGLDIEIDYAADDAWLPYGLRTPSELAARVPAMIAALARQWRPDIVVLACNTASTHALGATRAAVAIPVVGVVPPVKPAAAATRSGAIGVLATPATIASAYLDDLIAEFAADLRVVRFGAASLVDAAEAKLSGQPASRSAIDEAIGGLFDAPGGADIDVVALACTHFPLLSAELAGAAPRACLWLDSGAAIARRVAQVLGAHVGGARMRRAGFTGAGAGVRAEAAFRARGFADFVSIAAEQNFAAAQLGVSFTD